VNDERTADTWAARVSREYLAIQGLRHTNPWLFGFLLLVVIAALSLWGYDHFWGIPHLKDANERLEREVSAKRQEIVLLETQLAPVKTAAILKYGNADVQAMAQIAEDVRRFEKALRVEANKIRTFSVLIEAEFATGWTGGTPPDLHKWLRVAGAADEAEITFALDDNRTITIPFGSSDSCDLVPLSEGYVRMSYHANAKPGSQIFSESPEHIRELSRFWILAYGLQSEYSNSRRAHVRSIKLRFFANGVERFLAHLDPNMRFSLQGDTPNATTVLRINMPVPIEFVTP
jgi:hypothetical protein